MSTRRKPPRGERRRRRLDLFPEDASLGIIGGVGLAYLILVAHTFGHPVHWFYGGIGGTLGYIAVLVWTHRPSWVKAAAGWRSWLLRSGAALLVGAFVLAFVLIGYVLPGGQTESPPADVPLRGPPPGPGERVPLMGNAGHLTPGATFGAYSSTPPTSGPHYANPAGWGTYESEVADEQIAHNIEHGGVVVSYNLVEPAQVVEVSNAVKGLSGFPCYLILRPYPQIPQGTVVLTAWGVKQVLSGVDQAAVAQFVKAYAGRAGPERPPCAA